MTPFQQKLPVQNCRGPVPYGFSGRRAFLQTGLAGFATLSLPNILKLKSHCLAGSSNPSTSEKKAVIMVWQPGGMSHIDSYDPKPDSGSEYRGPFKLISTKVPGLQFTELLPRQAAIADKLVVLRSMRQTAGGHPAGSMQLLSGDPDTRDKPKPRYPDWMAVSNYLLAQKGPRTNPLPAYVGINPPPNTMGRPTLGTPIHRLSFRAIRIPPVSRCPILVLRTKTRFAALDAAPTFAKNWTRLNGALIRLGSLPPLMNLKPRQ